MDALGQLEDSDTACFNKIKGVFLLAVPFKGTPDVTKSLIYIVPSQIMGSLQTVNYNSYLQSLEDRWRKLIRTKARKKEYLPPIYVAYETQTTRICLTKRYLVDRNALFPFCDDNPYPAPMKDHSQIAKPLSNQDEIYMWAADRIQKSLKENPRVILADIDLKQQDEKTMQGANRIQKTLAKNSANEPAKINLEQSEYYFDTQSKLPIGIFSSKQLPSVRIYTELPYATYNCLDYEEFHLIKENSEYRVFSNEDSDSPVIFRFYYFMLSGNIVIYMDDLKFNLAQNSNSYMNRLDFMRFQRALMSNARLVFWDINKDVVLFRTGHILPTNMLRNENADVIEDIIQEIVRIERYFGITIRYQTKYTLQDLDTIKYIRDVLNGKEIIVGNSFGLTLKNEEERRQFLKNLKLSVPFADRSKYQFGFHHEEISFLGTTIDLGTWLVKVPEAIFEPSRNILLEILNQPHHHEPIHVNIKSTDPKRNISIWHYRMPAKHELKPTPIQMQE